MKFFCLLLCATVISAKVLDNRETVRRVNYGRIVGGEVVKPGEIPYIVSLRWNGDHFCGGSIISPNVIMTAAHCLYGYEDDPYEIVAGEWSLSDADSSEQRRMASRLLVHEDYNDRTITNDIALMWVDTPFEFNEFVSNIELPPPMHSATGAAPVSGWGYTEENGGELSDKLQVVTLQIISDTECRDKIPGNPGQVTDDMICAYHEPGGMDSCQGDSGGPLTNDNSGSLYVVGIVSWGWGCARPGMPGMYTEVSYFTEWVLNNM